VWLRLNATAGVGVTQDKRNDWGWYGIGEAPPVRLINAMAMVIKCSIKEKISLKKEIGKTATDNVTYFVILTFMSSEEKNNLTPPYPFSQQHTH
jgi:hypothetical protein